MKKKENAKYDEGTGTLEFNDGTTQCCGECGCKKRDWKRTAIIWVGVISILLIGKCIG